ncbi:hypothetical protein FGIG_02821 [Fasciola gigantica]|uniref:Uncharacterized protein n=1 Tax=Fasciola gigantica TaxID=46835 RepID=A0A504YUY2_FASGI|nr:hypothetical protein FGIG_02821 [Fasciola gigantica]
MGCKGQSPCLHTKVDDGKSHRLVRIRATLPMNTPKRMVGILIRTDRSKTSGSRTNGPKFTCDTATIQYVLNWTYLEAIQIQAG